ncbi:Sulfatase [Sphingobium herbicidovorans NBRC 16415]|uniref:Sulfatase n=1 Tax=Sphingobium herbicidovorans (strain ATCC 700291 / DSM 11019 / CCUG 56400 / KCTC 2939 / LMG 18315 / NBRC 16415 / MH) TaxID=1219045 RepID=A0A086P6R2_SPHHM|nr:arylsulfatase [Sphingobium herbicidovorans]KFG89080.1 Sulfatase [Sphingobium herbicidovorans NBRC 16415]
MLQETEADDQGEVISRRMVLLGLLSTSSLTLVGAQRPRAGSSVRPNVVLIVLDDVGFSDFGCFGGEIRTPSIDALAARGLRYNRFETRAICSPTRASLLTGRNSQSIGMADIPDIAAGPNAQWAKNSGYIPATAEMLPAALKRSGYATWAIGKWHLSPNTELEPGGPRTTWPRNRGFDYFYGFMSGWTDQYRPKLTENEQDVPVPQKPDYHLSSDLVDKSIDLIKRQRADAPKQPFFLYLAFGAAHAPIQVPKSHSDNYANVYEKGWDEIRAERFARMKRMGVIPENTILPPPNPGDRKWAQLSQDEQTLFARFMAVYAGFLEHADAQIGRLMDALKAEGVDEDTLVVVLSDNGAAGEGGATGSFDGLYRPNRLSLKDQLARIEDIGTAKTQAEYQRPWAMASVSPFRRYKLWPYLGGVRTPLVISWPRQIKGKGAIRPQFVEAIDIAPTIIEAAKGSFAHKINGVQQIPVAGKSILASFKSARAPSARTVQFFELRGNRAIVEGDWRAVGMHPCGGSEDQDRWMLFNVRQDFSESTDLASKYPTRLEHMKRLWWSEAKKYSEPPLTPVSKGMCTFSGYGEDFSDRPSGADLQGHR